MTEKKHLTVNSTQGETEKLNRYTFLEKPSIPSDGHKRGKILNQISFPRDHIGLYSIRFNVDNTKLIAGYGTGSIQIIDFDTGQPEYYVKESCGAPIPIMTIRCLPIAKNSFFAGGVCGNIYICKFQKDSNDIFAQEKGNEINCMDIDTNGDILATGGKDFTLRLYDVNVGKMKAKFGRASRYEDDTLTTKFHSRRIFSIKFHPKEQFIFLSGGWDDVIKVWDTRVKHGCVKNINGPHLCGDALDVKEQIILTGSWAAENSLQTWDLGTGKLISTIIPSNRVQTLDGEFLFCSQFFKSETHHDMVVCGGSGTGYVDVISMIDEKIIKSFPVNKMVQAIDSNTLSNIVYGGMEYVLRVAHIY